MAIVEKSSYCRSSIQAVKVSVSLSNVGSLAVEIFDLVNCSLSVVGFVLVFRSGVQNVSHQYQFSSELSSPGRSHYTNYLKRHVLQE